jgi:type IV pilus assembly protein PilF
MRREIVLLLVMGLLSLCLPACSRLERLNIVRPTAERGAYTQVAPVYEVSDKRVQKSSLAAADTLAGALDLYRAGQVDLADRQARQALQRDPGSADAHSLLAAIATSRGDGEAAGKHYAEAVAISPDNGVYANNYGTWLCGHGRAGESLAWFERALADPAYPTPADALANMGTCAERAGLSERAEANWRRALSLDPVNLPALAGLAGLQSTHGNGLEARAFVERWLELAPNDPDALQLAARIEAEKGDNVAAERYLSRFRRLAPTLPPAAQPQ